MLFVHDLFTVSMMTESTLTISWWLRAPEAENLIKLEASKILPDFQNCFYHALQFGMTSFRDNQVWQEN